MVTPISRAEVEMPFTPADAKGLLKSAIVTDDPVIFMSRKHVWDESEVPEDDDFTNSIGRRRSETRGHRRHDIAGSLMGPRRCKRRNNSKRRNLL